MALPQTMCILEYLFVPNKRSIFKLINFHVPIALASRKSSNVPKIIFYRHFQLDLSFSALYRGIVLP